MPHRFIRPTAVRNFILILVAVFSFRSSFSQSTDQNYPVTAQAFVVAQPGKKLSAYFSSTQALTVSLLLKDLTKTSIDVYLRWSIDGPGVRIASVDGYIPPQHFNLQRGMLQRFSGLDLQSMYFRQDVMEAQGLTGPPTRANLPEGFYTFRVQALEAGTGREVSNLGETYFSITSPLPPVINIPFNGATLASTGSATGASTGSANGASAGSLSLSKGPVEVQWMPRHYKLPGNITTYDLKVCKIPDGYEPQEAMDACVNPIIDDRSNPGTFFPSNTGIGNSIIGAWEQGARYAARVTVHEFDTNGEEVVFANEGRSEVTWFRYGEPCLSPESFTMKETGPGRVQLSWGAQPGIDNYKILYRPSTSSGGHPSASSGGQGKNNWKVQAVSGNTGVIQGLTKGKYEFAVQSGCAGQIPDHTQTWEMGSEDDDLDDLPPALVSPLQILVQVSGCNAVAAGNLADYYANFPRTDVPRTDVPGSGNNPVDSTKLKIPACALQSGAFADCDAELPVIPVPTGSLPLNSLRAGDVLGIYDFAAFVTEATQTPSGFSGKALVRLPFLQGALALAEFSGLKAWSAQGEGDQVRGGCVYEVSTFQLVNVSQTEVAEAKAKLLNTLAKQTDSTAFAGTLAGALLAYDRMSQTATADSVCRYKTAILQATGQITDALAELDSDHPVVTAILKDLKTIADSLQAGNTVDHITEKYEAILARLDSLKAADTDTNPSVLAIGNVQLNELTGQSARISWEATGDVAKTPSRYVIEYTDPNGATLPETVTSPQINLQRLLPGTVYKYRIIAYDGDQVIATYGEDAFTTPKRVVPMPENLAYTAVGSDSVRITWDANREHKSYKLIYTDESGNPRILYPTTNSALLTDLVPNKYYDYEIVAYNNERLASDPASARAAAGEQCKLGLTVFNAQNNPGMKGNTHSIFVTGCEPKDYPSGIALPPVGWSNGTPGTINKDRTEITFADGETVPTLFGRAIVVNPAKTTVYMAICTMGSGATAKNCTYSVKVTVPSPDCTGDFKITASSATFEKGKPVTIKAENCKGKLIWSHGYGSDQEIQLFATNNVIVSAKCVNGDQECLSNTISLVPAETKECDLSLHVSKKEVIERVFNTAHRNLYVFASGCENGVIDWTITADILTGGHRKVYARKVEITSMKSEKATIKAVCTTKGTSCPPVVLTTNTPLKKCGSKYLRVGSTSDKDIPGFVIVRSDGSGAFTLQDDYGNSYTGTAEDGVLVPLFKEERLVHTVLDEDCGEVSAVIPGLSYQIQFYERIKGAYFSTLQNQKPANIAVFKNPSSEYFFALNISCNGKVVWSNDNDPKFSGEGLYLRFTNGIAGSRGDYYDINYPTVTTTYFAACHGKIDNGPKVIIPAVNTQIVIVNSESCIKISNKKQQAITLGNNILLSVEGCGDEVSWSLGSIVVGTGSLLTYTPEKSGVQTYTATCLFPECTAAIDLEVKPCQFSIQPAENITIKPGPRIEAPLGQTLTLNAKGCEGGDVQWSTGETGQSITILPLTEKIYKAWCLINDITMCDYVLLVTVEAKAPDKIECPDFSLTYQPALKCSPVVVTPKGCPAGGTILWENTTTTSGEASYTFDLKEVRHMLKATCKSYNQSVTAQIEIVQLPPDIKINPGKVYAGVPVILRTSGCFNQECKDGTYYWTNLTSLEAYRGASITTTLVKSTDFTVSCGDGMARIVTINVEKPNCNPGITLAPKENANEVELNAHWCDTKYPITWTLQHQEYNPKGKPITTVKEHTTAKNRRKHTVKRPADITYTIPGIPGSQIASYPDIYTVNCVNEKEGVPCEMQYSVYTPKLYANFGSKPTLNTAGTTDTPSMPDFCSGLKFIETVGNGPKGTAYLYSDFCPGHVQWFAGNDRNMGSMIADLSGGARYQTSIINETDTYYYTCYYNGNKCLGEAQIEPDPAYSGGRIAATEEGTSTIIEKSCPDNVPLSIAMEGYYKTLLCQTTNLYKGDPAAAQAFLEDMIASIKARAPGVNIQFPANLNTVIDAMVAGDCNTAAQLLAAANGTTATINNNHFNNQLVDPYNRVIDDIIPEEGAQCNAAPAPLAEGGMKETLNGRIASYEFTGLFIAPDGRAVQLPAGTKPKILSFTKDFPAPPSGTLQGFQTADGRVYFAEMSFGQFLGYRLIKTPLCPEEYEKTIYRSSGTKAYYIEKFSENGKCGYRVIEGAYTFEPTGNQLIDIRVPVAGETVVTWEYEKCAEAIEYLTAAGRNKLALKLKDFGHNNTGITISDCVKGDKHTISVEGIDKSIVNKLIQINMCWDGKKWVITHSFKPGALKIPTGFTGTVAEVEAISNEHANRVKETGVPRSDDGENYYEGIDFIQALVEVKEATLTLCNNAKVPEKYWETKDPGYAKSPFHGPTLSGIGDGAIAELKDIPEMVGFGLEIATEPGKARELWNGIQSITPDKVKKMALGAAQEKLDKYAAGGNTMKHEAGKDAVAIAMFVSGAVKSFATNGKKIAELGEVVGKLDDVADDVLEKVTRNVDEVAGKSINKALKDGDLGALDVEEIAEEVKDATSKADKSWLENFIKGKQYEKRIDSKIDAGDVAYFDDAASKFGISASELKGMDKVDQLQINIGNGNYFIADNAWSRKVTINGKTEIHVYINETKLSGTTPPTRRQSEFYAELAKTSTNFTSRSIRKDATDIIPKDAKIIIKSVIKTSGNGSVNDIYNIQKTF